MWSAFNLLKRPIARETLEAWAKIAEDVAKVATITLPAIVYSSHHYLFKWINGLLLVAIIYSLLLLGRYLREHFR